MSREYKTVGKTNSVDGRSINLQITKGTEKNNSNYRIPQLVPNNNFMLSFPFPSIPPSYTYNLLCKYYCLLLQNLTYLSLSSLVFVMRIRDWCQYNTEATLVSI